MDLPLATAKHRRLPFLVAAVLAVAACSDSPAFGRINETTWEVVSIADDRLESSRATIELDRPSLGVARVGTPCRVVEVPFAFDTDGEAVSFGELGKATGQCPSLDMAVDVKLAAALAAADSWHLVDDTTMEVRNAEGEAVLEMNMTSAPRSSRLGPGEIAGH